MSFNIFSIEIIILLILSIFIIVGLLYNVLYKYYNLTRNLKSFILFFINVLILLSFVLTIILLPVILKKAIYIENLSYLNNIKYFIFVILIILCFIIYLIVYFIFNYNLYSFLQNLRFPYLKEEMRLLLVAIGDISLGNLASNTLNKLHDNKQFRFSFFLSHFFIFSIFNVIQSIFFINFALFHGDLRYNIILLPISFIIWILSFFDYYFNYFFKGSLNYINNVLIVSSKNDLETKDKFILITGYDLNFNLTPFGITEGFVNTDLCLNSLANVWLKAQQLNYYFSSYQSFVKFIVYFNFILRFISWINISIVFFFNYFDIKHTGIFSIIKRSFSTTKTLFSPLEARWAKEQCKPQVAKAMGNNASADHPLIVDPAITNDQGHYKAAGHATHGNASESNPSAVLHPSRDFKGPNSKGQKMVYPDSPSYIDPEHLKKETIPNSGEFFKDSTVKENMAKNSYRNWEEDNT